MKQKHLLHTQPPLSPHSPTIVPLAASSPPNFRGTSSIRRLSPPRDIQNNGRLSSQHRQRCRPAALHRPGDWRQQASLCPVCRTRQKEQRLTGRFTQTAASASQSAAASSTSSSSLARSPRPSTSSTPPAMDARARTRERGSTHTCKTR